LIAPAIARTGLRLIAPDRPGFGRSTLQDSPRTYNGWARDIEHLANANGFERFGTVAYSAGAPYAIATAEALGGRVTQLALISGVAPAEMPGYRKSTGPTDRTMLTLAPRLPWLARSLVGRAMASAAKNPRRFGRQLNRDFKSPADQKLLDDELRSTLVTLFREATRNGPAGIVEDFAVWARPSTLALDEIRTPVRLWHGTDDQSVSIAHSRYVASQLPCAELTEWPNAGHLHPEDRWAEVLATLR
jgi:pimeloyl-ACP methyl ester carboxylesterase